ncbi:hypothetical protein DV737_g5481, partial [Chaetothyriales sp. CBS 132003]
MASKANSGIHTAADGSSFIPASKRPDGSLRKEIKVRPGFKPTEDIAAYKTPTAAARSQLSATVPGSELASTPPKSDVTSKNAKRREAARKRAAAAAAQDNDPETPETTAPVSDIHKLKGAAHHHFDALEEQTDTADAADAEKQKKIRNALKKLKAVRDLKAKAAAGEKMSPDQLIKIGKEDELARDLRKLGYDGAEMGEAAEDQATSTPEGAGERQTG